VASWIFDDGGRTAAGFKGSAGDCVARAIAIASGRPYGEVYRRLAESAGAQRRTKLTRKKHERASARSGILTGRKWFKDYMAELGFAWVPTMQIGSGCKVHLRADELPSGRIIASVSNHFVAVIDGQIHDTHDPSRGGKRCVYGYWRLAEAGQ
jgi:hypothetical protein